MIAIVSDIHGNLEALTTVLAEIERRGVSRILCLGDVIGYGPNPVECLDLIREKAETVLMGNHDFAVLYEPYNFNSGAESASYWTRSRLDAEPDDVVRLDRWQWLANLPVRHEKCAGEGEDKTCLYTAVHASPRRPINEYIFPDDIYTNAAKFPAIFDRFDSICFCGHTHVPGVFLEGPDFYSPDELNMTFSPMGEKAVINVGSVGQPRDRDPRASFVLMDDAEPENPTFTFVRLPYDLEATAAKVRATKELDNFLGARLADGR